MSVVSVNFSLKNPNPNLATFQGIFAWQVCMHNYFTFLYKIECVSQHYNRTLENINIWDITKKDLILIVHGKKKQTIECDLEKTSGSRVTWQRL